MDGSTRHVECGFRDAESGHATYNFMTCTDKSGNVESVELSLGPLDLELAFAWILIECCGILEIAHGRWHGVSSYCAIEVRNVVFFSALPSLKLWGISTPAGKISRQRMSLRKSGGTFPV
jgi:hypothetical protein